jgi:pimeloyl-ACP methyl ester carboxylesterase
MMGWGSFSAEEAVRRGLETATSEAYRAEHPEELEQLVRWRLADSSSTAAHNAQTKAGARFDLSGDVEHITSPTLVIHGAEDRYVPAANAAALAESIPGARLRVLDRAGHLVFIERSAEVNRDVVSFLKPRKQRKTPKPPAEGAEDPKTERRLPGLSRAIYRWVRRVLAWFS